MNNKNRGRRHDDDQPDKISLMKALEIASERYTGIDPHSKADMVQEMGRVCEHYTDVALQNRMVMLHELQEHRIELEMQNAQLREVQQSLEEAINRYADLYDYAPVGYLTLDEFGMVKEINLTGAVMLGTERLNIVGELFNNFLTPSSAQILLAHLQQTFTLPGNSVTEVLIKVKDGLPRLISLESLAMPGEKRTCRMVMQDVTEQRRMAIALQISRSAQDALLKAIPALVFYMDINLRYLSCSQKFANFVDCKLEEVAGKKIQDLFPTETAESLQQIFSSVLDTGVPLYDFEHSLSDSCEVSHYFSTVVSPFRDSHGKILGLVGVCLDITAIKTALNENNELISQNRKLTRNLFAAQEEERRYLARELHDELGQWFTAIQTEAQMICNLANNHEPIIHESALSISKSAVAVHEVIRGMMHRLRPSMLDELGLVDSLRELQQQWRRRYPDIICDFTLDSLPDDFGEELNITIYRLIQESLNNIARHAHAQHVTVSLELSNTGNDNGIIMLRVEDDGIGFDNNKVRSETGLLGMRERVIAAGGEFSIDSKPGMGTKIFAWLPVNKSTLGN